MEQRTQEKKNMQARLTAVEEKCDGEVTAEFLSGPKLTKKQTKKRVKLEDLLREMERRVDVEQKKNSELVKEVER